MYQKAVFDYFGAPITHVINEEFSHGDFLNHICRTVTDTDYLIIFDIDCVPVRKDWLEMLLNDLAEPRTIAGAAQTANHLRDAKNLYVSPFFFGISTAYLAELGYPDMTMTDNADAGQNLTDVIVQQGGHVKYWWPTSMESAQWYLHHPEHTRFGSGTTYNHRIYHAFESRFDQSGRFKKKCKKILSLLARARMKWNNRNRR